ncbi:MAG: hypothetical protein HOE69_08010 [Euryarchaeota archaeon]|jgi:hypothetical protein|nr:hypothetical protein [Euryarchaeota archaeon]
MIEATLSEWKKWYAENRADECTVIGRKDEEFDDNEVFKRLWNVQDGKPPEGGEAFNSKAWRKRGVIPAPGLVIVTGPGHSPLILTNEARKHAFNAGQNAKKGSRKNGGKTDSDGNKQQDKKPASRALNKPYNWRCRDCGEMFEANQPEIHCHSKPRQRADVSPDSTKWFNDFLEQVEWTYIPHHEISNGLVGVVEDKEADAVAKKAGESLAQILNETEMAPPKFFDMYNQMTNYIRVSDLKEHSKFKRVIHNIAKWRKTERKAMKNSPLGMIEIGHAFDEFLTETFENINSEEWVRGQRVRFDCEELGVSVGGTPDLNFQGVPVETKTLRVFPHEVPEDNNQKSIFKYKWKRNYSKQAALYLQGVENEYMLLLLISRESGAFTVVPVNDEAMEGMRENWVVWAKKYKKQLDAYKQLISEEE